MPQLNGDDTPGWHKANAQATGERGCEGGASEQPKSVVSRTSCCI